MEKILGMRDASVYQRLQRCLKEGNPAVLATVVECDEPSLVGLKQLSFADAAGEFESWPLLPVTLASEVAARARALLQEGRASRRVRVERLEGIGRARVAFERFDPAFRLVIAGAGHIAQPTHEIAAIVGFSVTVLDDRPEYAHPARFPRADRVICEEFTSAVQKLELDASTALVVVTRGHLHDLEVLRAIGTQKPAYVGMIGSRRRVLTVFDKLKEEGFSQSFIEKLHAPIGLDIGAESPAEIGLAIVAEVVDSIRGGRAARMRDRA